jgi:hypothetical protein
MELHVIVPGRAAELVARIVDGRLVIVPPEPSPQSDGAEASRAPAE